MLGEGYDAHHGMAYTDMFFLADIKIFYMSVPLRTVRYALGDGRFICAIGLVTGKNVVSPAEWVNYTNFMRNAESTLQGDWTIFSGCADGVLSRLLSCRARSNLRRACQYDNSNDV